MGLNTFRAIVFFFGAIFCNASLGQKSIAEGIVSYRVSVIAINKPVPPGLEGAGMTIFLKPFESRTELKTVAGTETTFYDSRKGRGAILKEYSGQKLMITFTRENWEHKNLLFSNLKFLPESRDSIIAGHFVRSASAELSRGGRLFVFYAPDLRPQNLNYNFALPQLEGLPVLLEIESDGIIFTYILENLNIEPVSAIRFVIPHNGFRIMSYEENLKLNDTSE